MFSLPSDQPCYAVSWEMSPSKEKVMLVIDFSFVRSCEFLFIIQILMKYQDFSFY